MSGHYFDLKILRDLKKATMTVSEVATAYGVTVETARKHFLRLASFGLIERRVQRKTGGAPVWLWGIA